MKMRAIVLSVLIASIALIGWGLYLIYPPACPLGIGLLLWGELAAAKLQAEKKKQ